MKKYRSYDLSKIFKASQTVFTTKELMLLWGIDQPQLLHARLSDYVKRGKLYRIKRGIYAKDKSYNKFELATKIFTPSYISLETVLSREGIIFQHYDSIFVVSYLSREIDVNGHHIVYRKIKNEILVNTVGIVEENNYFIATKERAFLDALYLYKDYYFDNLDPLDRERLFEIVKIYSNRELAKKVKRYFNA